MISKIEQRNDMPLYYFDIKNQGQLLRDVYGADCDDDDDARTYAVALLPDIAGEDLPAGDQREIVAIVRNETGSIVYEATLALSGRWWPERR